MKHMKHLQHTNKTYETLENIGLQHVFSTLLPYDAAQSGGQLAAEDGGLMRGRVGQAGGGPGT
jgi:hypothetical protein